VEKSNARAVQEEEATNRRALIERDTQKVTAEAVLKEQVTNANSASSVAKQKAESDKELATSKGTVPPPFSSSSLFCSPYSTIN
jgi:hypothetical protein